MAVYDIRPAQPSDINGILGFQRAAIAGVPKCFYADPAKEAWLRTPVHGLNDLLAGGRYFVATAAGALIAGAGWEPCDHAPGAAALRGVFVHPGHKGGGVGRRVVSVAEDAAATMGHTRFFVPASLNATGFYERLGYLKEGNAEITLNGSRLIYCRMWKHVA
jgi:GNAT superfamily N-acetyltransferase